MRRKDSQCSVTTRAFRLSEVCVCVREAYCIALCVSRNYTYINVCILNIHIYILYIYVCMYLSIYLFVYICTYSFTFLESAEKSGCSGSY